MEGPLRNFGGHNFELITEIDPKRDSDGEIILDHPEHRYGKADTAKLHRHGQGPFCKFRMKFELWVAGVYVLVVEGRPLYVGKTENLEQRFNNGYGQIAPRNCYVGGQSTNCRINKLILGEAMDGRTVQLLFRKTSDIASLEGKLLRQLRPAWNIQSA